MIRIILFLLLLAAAAAHLHAVDALTPLALVVLVLARVQLLDAMHLSQERSRMASLGSRHGGFAREWAVLQRPPL